MTSSKLQPRIRLPSGARLRPRRRRNTQPTLHPAVNTDCNAPTSSKEDGVNCSSGSAAADCRCLAIHGTFDPGWPVDALQVPAEAKHPVFAEAHHRSGHCLPCEQPSELAPPRSPYVCSRRLRQSVSSTTIANHLLTVLCRGDPRQRQRARTRPRAISIPWSLPLDL